MLLPATGSPRSIRHQGRNQHTWQEAPARRQLMKRIHRAVWNKVTRSLVAVAETVPARTGKDTVLATSTASFSDPSVEPPATRIYTTDSPNVEMPGGTITIPMQNLTVSTDTVGEGTALDIMPSYMALNFIICCDGLYPTSVADDGSKKL